MSMSACWPACGRCMLLELIVHPCDDKGPLKSMACWQNTAGKLTLHAAGRTPRLEERLCRTRTPPSCTQTLPPS